MKWKTVPSQPELPTLEPRGPAGVSGPSRPRHLGTGKEHGLSLPTSQHPVFCLPCPGETPSRLEPPIPTWVMLPSPTKLGRLMGSGEGSVLLAFRAWTPQWPLVEGPVQPPCWTSTFFPLSTAAVSSCNYSLTFLPIVIPKPVSSYFPKAPLKSTFSTFQIGTDSVRPHIRQPTRLPHPWDSLGTGNCSPGKWLMCPSPAGSLQRRVASRGPCP